jgi:hypothetical protein
MGCLTWHLQGRPASLVPGLLEAASILQAVTAVDTLSQLVQQCSEIWVGQIWRVLSWDHCDAEC